MASKGSQSSIPSGVIEYAPATITAAGRSSGGNRGSYENKSQVSYYDKQSGSYARETATEKATAGEFQWKNGTSGNRSEYKQTETVRVGDKSGYTEIYNEQRIRDVTYNNHNYGGKDVVSNEHSGAYGENDGACDENDGECSDDDSACSEDGGAYSDDDSACSEDGGAYSDVYSDDGGAYSDDGGYDSGFY